MSSAARLAIQFTGPRSAHWRQSLIDNRLDKAADITIFGLSILFVAWFYRARINAESHGYRQRRARGWALWGWIVCFLAIAGALLIAIIRTVSTGPVGSPPPVPWLFDMRPD